MNNLMKSSGLHRWYTEKRRCPQCGSHRGAARRVRDRGTGHRKGSTGSSGLKPLEVLAFETSISAPI